MIQIARYLTIDLLKNRAVIGSFLLFVAIGWGLFFIENQPEKALLMVMQVTLLLLPLITLIFSCIYYYNSYEFTVLLLSNPIKRSAVIQAFFIALSISFSFAYTIGIGLPLLLNNPSPESVIMLVSGNFLLWIFVGIALFICTKVNDKVKGIGLVLILWAFFAFLFDGLLILIMYQFGAYPIEKLILILTFLNPIDISRISVIMQTDASAMMGLSGAVFVDFFGSMKGLVISFSALLLWVAVMYLGSVRNFRKSDL
ncbi:ABC transporter permease [Cryomorpha ignava]|uniref:ABC transporter permease n=1 Tax=Cryomorpha ignava TaxID=101383 RepID=A0A7K3WQH5_9FLAO|nr:ABC transporter permease subunit [Cryomorpha ignava]NEN23909.1 ABC transporter permease [Cryomorpha ignava]